VIDLFPLVRPFVHRIEPERAHALALRALALGVVPPPAAIREPMLATSLFGRPLAHPIGLAAGFDKNARVFERMAAQNLAFVEIGGVTPRPRAGNPKPRVFRLRRLGAVINRMGFPNEGLATVLARVAARRGDVVLGVNLAADVESADSIDDLATLARAFAPYAQFLTLDISCPNTTNGQIFLDPDRLRELLTRVRACDLGGAALVAKLSPDVDDDRLDALTDVMLAAKLDGIIACNTTRERPVFLAHEVHAAQAGGLSGPPLAARATAVLARIAARTRGRTTLIGVGGIRSGADAYAKIRAGASALQLYTGLVYEGPAIVGKIARELATLLRRDGFTSVGAAVGADVYAQDAPARSVSA